jgi:hypothetical protein
MPQTKETNMNATPRSTSMEIALLNKLDHLPATPRKTIRISQFDFSRYPVLCWYHGINRRGRRYSLQCDVCEDGTLAITCRPVLRTGQTLRMPKAKHFPGQIAG